MLRGTLRCFRAINSTVQAYRTTVDVRPWVGCSHWTTPHRPHQSLSTYRNQGDGLFDPPELAQDGESKRNTIQNESDDFMDIDESQEGIIIDQIDTHDDASNSSHQTQTTTPIRPTLPTSIKKLNRLLSHSRDTAIPESDLIEKFVKGRGPGGQAINKTNSSVSLIHIPTGIRIQSQPTRSREENRKIARKILGERLDLIRARAGQDTIAPGSDARDGSGSGSGTEAEKMGSKKDKERVLAKQFSRDEIRWEKERRRKSNKAKKAKKKHSPGSGGTESDKGSDLVGGSS